MERYMRFHLGKAKALTLSYDDGVKQDARFIELLKSHGIKGTFNLNSGRFGTGRRLDEDAVKNLYFGSGMEVAMHGFNHAWPNALKGAEIYKEYITDKENLEKLFGKVVRGMAYAYGVYTEEVVSVLKELGVAYSRTINNTHTFDIPTDWLKLNPTCHHNDPKLNDLADWFIQLNPNTYYNKQPLLFYLWGHTYEFDDNNNWNIIEDFCAKMGGNEDIWYATNIEVYDYVKAYEGLSFSSDNTLVYNPSTIDVYFRLGEKDCLAKAGKTTKI